MSVKFNNLHLNKWRQFADINISFHEKMTILTGANGAGKTTILNLLARHFGWSINLIGTPKITKRGAMRYFSGAGKDKFEDDGNSLHRIGRIKYSNQEEAVLDVTAEVAENYKIQINNQQTVEGIYITSHRPVYAYQRVDQIPTQISAAEQLFSQYVDNLRQYYIPRSKIESPSYRLKRSLISLATFGYGNKAVEGNSEALSIFESFQEVLHKVFPPDLEFREIVIRLPDVILRCSNSEFSLDAASGGIAALIDLSWQIHMKSLIAKDICVVLDEPENHLHPRLQRAVLPGLLEAFPKIQIIAATHNPFVVTSVPDSNVIVLDFDQGFVNSRSLSEFDRAASANQVLTDVLGVPFPMPLWVEDEIEKVVRKLDNSQINERVLSETRRKLTELGLGGMFPAVIDRLLDRAGGEN